MKLSVYTSCSVNYLPKARVLATSLARHHPDARLTLCLNDLVPPWLDLSDEPFAQVWLPEDLGYDRAWIFKHNVMELSTAVKGRALRRLIDEDPADLHVYLDPDVWVMNNLAPVIGYLGDASIGLVPHILAPEETEIGVRLTEMSVTEHGIYNLGHLFVRPDRNGRAFACWWAERLDRHCYDDRERGLFTDQRWVDLAPAIFDGVRILRQPNLDVASWNLFGRTIRQNQPGDASAFTVDAMPLLTYHFSGTGPTGTHRRIRGIFDPCNGATAEIERLYEAAIARNGQASLAGHPWGHATFDDGTPVTAEARKLYRRHEDLQRHFPDPFAVPDDGPSLLGWLRRNRPGATGRHVVPARLLDQAFADLFDETFYLASHPDAEADVAAGRFGSAVEHYCKIGSRLFLDPNEFFVSSYYHDRAASHDRHILRGTGKRHTLLWHYLVSGLPNGLEPVEHFDSHWYCQRNPDVATALRQGQVSTPFAHFVRQGSAEGRDPGPEFSAEAYLATTPAARRLHAAGRVRGGFGALVRLGGVAGRLPAEGADRVRA